MSLRYIHSTILIFLLSLTHSALAVTDENICATECQYCCRDKQCRSESECKGNFTPFVILGIVAGAIVGLLVLIKLYIYLKSKVPKKDPAKQRLTKPRARAQSPKPAKVSKKSRKSDKEEKKKGQSKQEVYLQIENDSIVGVDNSSIKPVEAGDQEKKSQISSRTKLEPDTNRSERKRENSAPKTKSSSKANEKDKSSSSKSKSRPSSVNKGKGASANKNMISSSASGTNKERGKGTNSIKQPSKRSESGAIEKAQG